MFFPRPVQGVVHTGASPLSEDLSRYLSLSIHPTPTSEGLSSRHDDNSSAVALGDMRSANRATVGVGIFCKESRAATDPIPVTSVLRG